MVPAFEKHALQIVVGGEIDVAYSILGGGAVTRPHRPHLCSEVHAPPDAHIFLRTYPRGVGDFRRLVEVDNQVGIDQVDGRAPYLHRAPRGGETARNIGFDAVGQRCEIGFEHARHRVAAEHHLGIVVECGFMHRAVDAAVGAERHRRVGIGDREQRQVAVFELVGLEVGRDGPRLPGGSEAEFRQFVGDGQRISGRRLVAQGHAVVKGAETQRQLFARQRHGQLVVVVDTLLVLAPRLLPGLVVRRALKTHLAASGIVPSAGHDPKARRRYDLPAVDDQTVGRGITAAVDHHAQASVGRKKRLHGCKALQRSTRGYCRYHHFFHFDLF